ncbi:peptidoglycan-binding protein LysM [Pukyongiella litopenaei]|uniref:Potassium binding protein Kbp n=1 Tax=Pukyongiella litopenaei TaxID=2605946 RepID=A0A2S0MUK4_9RHOB|nr:peptidoglycan-binding protein LysM [Pukyongiella litopenaei]AVO39555.1 peptidoglycan-binding protein LysM [Pukyongiella litopenaei]
MGLWNFMKESGKSLFGGGDDAAPDAETLKKEVADLGLDASGLDISVDGDKVKVSGMGVSQEAREKVVLAVGNVSGVAAVEDDGDAEETVFHTVERGDTLSAIARKTLGSANRYMEIFEANKPMLTDPDKIYPGQVLRIPQDRMA